MHSGAFPANIYGIGSFWPSEGEETQLYVWAPFSVGVCPGGASAAQEKTFFLNVYLFQLQNSDYARDIKTVIKQTSKHPKTQRNENLWQTAHLNYYNALWLMN